MERWVQVWQITDPVGDPLPYRFPAHRVRDVVSAAQSANEDLYSIDRDATVTLMESFSGTRPHLALHTIRRVNLPSEDANGRIVDLSINEAHGLAEGTHFLFCPRNVVVCLYNHQGPRIKRLGSWLHDRLGLDVSFVPLLRADTWAVVEQMRTITAVEVSIPAAQARALEPPPDNDDDLLTALRASGDASQSGSLRVSWTVGRGRDRMPQSRMRGLAESLFRLDKRGFKVAKIHGRLEGVKAPVPVDLIEDQLVTRRTVDPERQRSRRISTASAYEAMDDTYDSFRDQIQTAVDPVPDTRITVPDRLIPRRIADDGNDGQ